MSIALPLEIWGEILSWLEFEHLCACESVCKEWYSTDLVNKSIYSVSYEDTRYINTQRLGRMLNLRSLCIDTEAGNSALEKLVALRDLDLGLSGVLTNELHTMTNLLSLKLGADAISKEGCLMPVSLRSLEIGICKNEMTDRDLACLTNLTSLSFDTAERLTGECFNKLSNLTSLSLDDHGTSGFFVGADDIFRSLSNLTKLALWCDNNLTDMWLRPLDKLHTLILIDNKLATSEGLNALPSLAQLVIFEPEVVIDPSKLKSSIKVYRMGEDKLNEEDNGCDYLYTLNQWYKSQ